MRSIFIYLMSSVGSKFIFLVQFQNMDLESMHRRKWADSKECRRELAASGAVCFQ